MADPTISTTGASSGFLLITDQDGKAHRIPKTAICNVLDSSNVNVHRLDVYLASNEITLIFSSSETLNAFLTNLDSLY
ncbi:MAG: hypothetical protein KAT69_01705 [Candidatus Aminicenantes bacterium]|nr:hypothetical protein [Candidatus Aminicenantes bacterium]